MADRVPLTDDTRRAILSAAKLLTGHKRRRFQAEMAHQYCGGSARLAETTFGWGREAVRTGLNELRSGIRCVEDFESRGRPTTEQRHPAVEESIRQLVDPHAQADPKFQTPFAYTRITAKAVRDALVGIPELEGQVPTRQTVGDILNRLGYKLRRVQKARPQKNSRRRTPSSPTCGTPASSLPPTRTRCESPSIPRRK
jgi:Rhodopirellula transposase DDE domain